MRVFQKHFLIGMLMALTVGVVQAQGANAVTATNATINLNYSVPESLTVTAAYGSGWTGTLTNNGQPIVITETWNLQKTRIVEAAGYFTTGNALAGNNGLFITSAQIFTVIQGGSTVLPCTQTIASFPAGTGNSCQEFFNASEPLGQGTATQTWMYSLGAGVSPVAGTYNGMLTVAAVAN
jgi:hypothetical protein